MSAPFSIIIPTLNAASALPDTFEALLPGVERGMIAQVIVSDGGSSDNTLELSDALGAEIIQGPPGRGGQLRRGAEQAHAPWLLFLHADTQLPTTWTGALGTHIAAHPEMAATFRLAFRARGLMAGLTASWANLRTGWWDLPYGDQGLLISRALYDQVGGYQDQPLMEDVAIARSLRGRIKLLDEVATTSADRYLRQGWIKRGTSNLITLARYAAGTSPQKLAQSYHKR
ncbi:MAG: TIGR04283 family arsenosugar biosynthesis glycosyltransferase [Litoreibacter sp.]